MLATSMLALLPPAVVSADEDIPPAIFAKLDQPLYVVTQSRYGEGSGAGDAKFDDVIATGISYPKGKKDPAAGAKIPLYARGRRAGDLVVRKLVSVECDGSGLAVRIPKGFQFPLSGFALATASKGIHEHDTGLRSLTAAESKELLALAKKKFADKKEFGSHEPDGKTELVGAVYTRVGPKLAYVVGTVKSAGKRELDTVFVIARVAAKNLIPEKIIPGISADLEDGQDLDFTTFAEQVDLDGDGVDEIVTENRGYETKSYTVWKRKGSTWESVGGGGGSGC